MVRIATRENSAEYAMIRFADSSFGGLAPEQITQATLTVKRKNFSHLKWGLLSGWKTNTGSFPVYAGYYPGNNWNSLGGIDAY
ncbi:MAG: hypothetical protein LBL01_05475, partial [Bifidobacteriaceae bacterium]|nr:hypothetical protein [Bifidobacteriaceae bacterium]